MRSGGPSATASPQCAAGGMARRTQACMADAGVSPRALALLERIPLVPGTRATANAFFLPRLELPGSLDTREGTTDGDHAHAARGDESGLHVADGDREERPALMGDERVVNCVCTAPGPTPSAAGAAEKRDTAALLASDEGEQMGGATWNVGLVPQTWVPRGGQGACQVSGESVGIQGSYMNVFELAEKPALSGEVYAVKILGAVAPSKCTGSGSQRPNRGSIATAEGGGPAFMATDQCADAKKGLNEEGQNAWEEEAYVLIGIRADETLAKHVGGMADLKGIRPNFLKEIQQIVFERQWNERNEGNAAVQQHQLRFRSWRFAASFANRAHLCWRRVRPDSGWGSSSWLASAQAASPKAGPVQSSAGRARRARTFWMLPETSPVESSSDEEQCSSEVGPDLDFNLEGGSATSEGPGGFQGLGVSECKETKGDAPTGPSSSTTLGVGQVHDAGAGSPGDFKEVLAVEEGEMGAGEGAADAWHGTTREGVVIDDGVDVSRWEREQSGMVHGQESEVQRTTLGDSAREDARKMWSGCEETAGPLQVPSGTSQTAAPLLLLERLNLSLASSAPPGQTSTNRGHWVQAVAGPPRGTGQHGVEFPSLRRRRGPSLAMTPKGALGPLLNAANGRMKPMAPRGPQRGTLKIAVSPRAVNEPGSAKKSLRAGRANLFHPPSPTALRKAAARSRANAKVHDQCKPGAPAVGVHCKARAQGAPGLALGVRPFSEKTRGKGEAEEKARRKVRELTARLRRGLGKSDLEQEGEDQTAFANKPVPWQWGPKSPFHWDSTDDSSSSSSSSEDDTQAVPLEHLRKQRPARALCRSPNADDREPQLPRTSVLICDLSASPETDNATPLYGHASLVGTGAMKRPDTEDLAHASISARSSVPGELLRTPDSEDAAAVLASGGKCLGDGMQAVLEDRASWTVAALGNDRSSAQQTSGSWERDGTETSASQRDEMVVVEDGAEETFEGDRESHDQRSLFVEKANLGTGAGPKGTALKPVYGAKGTDFVPDAQIDGVSEQAMQGKAGRIQRHSSLVLLKCGDAPRRAQQLRSGEMPLGHGHDLGQVRGGAVSLSSLAEPPAKSAVAELRSYQAVPLLRGTQAAAPSWHGGARVVYQKPSLKPTGIADLAFDGPQRSLSDYGKFDVNQFQPVAWQALRSKRLYAAPTSTYPAGNDIEGPALGLPPVLRGFEKLGGVGDKGGQEAGAMMKGCSSSPDVCRGQDADLAVQGTSAGPISPELFIEPASSAALWDQPCALEQSLEHKGDGALVQGKPQANRSPIAAQGSVGEGPAMEGSRAQPYLSKPYMNGGAGAVPDSKTRTDGTPANGAACRDLHREHNSVPEPDVANGGSSAASSSSSTESSGMLGPTAWDLGESINQSSVGSQSPEVGPSDWAWSAMPVQCHWNTVPVPSAAGASGFGTAGAEEMTGAGQDAGNESEGGTSLRAASEECARSSKWQVEGIAWGDGVVVDQHQKGMLKHRSSAGAAAQGAPQGQALRGMGRAQVAQLCSTRISTQPSGERLQVQSGEAPGVAVLERSTSESSQLRNQRRSAAHVSHIKRFASVDAPPLKAALKKSPSPEGAPAKKSVRFNEVVAVRSLHLSATSEGRASSDTSDGWRKQTGPLPHGVSEDPNGRVVNLADKILESGRSAVSLRPKQPQIGAE